MGLPLISIENDIYEQIDRKDLIEEFVSKNARRMTCFK